VWFWIVVAIVLFFMWIKRINDTEEAEGD